MPPTVYEAVNEFHRTLRAKLHNAGARGQPEDQLRSPFEQLLKQIGAIAQVHGIECVGESTQADLSIRPDFAVTVKHVLIGHVELKAPGKGADPRLFTDKHDREQWKKLQSLPNLLYSDGIQFSHWKNGKQEGKIFSLDSPLTVGGVASPPPGFELLFRGFLEWQPVPPRSARELAQTSARLCRLLRDEVTEQLARKLPGLTDLADEWRTLLFPEADNKTFADGYAQAVTFGLLMARAKGISLAGGLAAAAQQLAQQSSLIGTALRLLTDSRDIQGALATSLGSIVRVLDVVDWSRLSKGNSDAWLYFYEDFLSVYDNRLRKQTGSYYTEAEVVRGMVRLVDQVLREHFPDAPLGFASAPVRIADPATGTGTFFLGVLRHIAQTATTDGGAGTVSDAVTSALRRTVALEMQLGPYAVAQLRIFAEVMTLTRAAPTTEPRLFVTNTLGDPHDDPPKFSVMVEAIGKQRRAANRVMRDETITVVLGNPPYKNAAKGKGAWIEHEDKNTHAPAPLARWLPPADWGVGAHAKHLRNLYIYFWRWATWKVFDYGDGKSPGPHDGIVCFITVAGFLNGPGFQRMRAYLRETCTDIWVIDASPEGHQPDASTRFFQGVMQPVCIVLAARSRKVGNTPAPVHFHALPQGSRRNKFDALNGLNLNGLEWTDCPTDLRAPFLPASTGSWASFPALDDLFVYNGSGVMPGRTWIIAPDEQTLIDRWQALKAAATPKQMDELFQPHMVDEMPGDRSSEKVLKDALPQFDLRRGPKPGKPSTIVETYSVFDDPGSVEQPVQYGFRTLDRQFIIPDKRLINRPNPELWVSRSKSQLYLTAPSDRTPTAGPALSFTGLVPDLHHYNGRGGRVFPLWADAAATEPNIKPALLQELTKRYSFPVTAPNAMAYLAAIAAHPAYTARFQPDLSTPGLRIPITSDPVLFHEAVALGERVLWLFTFGERMAAPQQGRPHGLPRLPAGRAPTIAQGNAIPIDEDRFPDELHYDAKLQRLSVGTGHIDHVSLAMWDYQISGKRVLRQWFSYRKLHRERPIIGDKRPPSALEKIRAGAWQPEYTTELLELLNILGLLTDMEPAQADLLDRVCEAPLLSVQELAASGALERATAIASAKEKKRNSAAKPPLLFPEQ